MWDCKAARGIFLRTGQDVLQGRPLFSPAFVDTWAGLQSLLPLTQEASPSSEV